MYCMRGHNLPLPPLTSGSRFPSSPNMRAGQYALCGSLGEQKESTRVSFKGFGFGGSGIARDMALPSRFSVKAVAAVCACLLGSTGRHVLRADTALSATKNLLCNGFYLSHPLHVRYTSVTRLLHLRCTSVARPTTCMSDARVHALFQQHHVDTASHIQKYLNNNKKGKVCAALAVAQQAWRICKARQPMYRNYCTRIFSKHVHFFQTQRLPP